VKYNDRLECNLSNEPSDQYNMPTNFNNDHLSSDYSHMNSNIGKFGKLAFVSSLRKPLPHVNTSVRNKNQLHALKMGNSFEAEEVDEFNNSSKNILSFTPFEF
jgi:hypothetical protein